MEGTETPVTLDIAGTYFPGGMTRRAILKRIRHGVRGVKLQATFDGYQYWTTRGAVERFIETLALQRAGTVGRVAVPKSSAAVDLSWLKFKKGKR